MKRFTLFICFVFFSAYSYSQEVLLDSAELSKARIFTSIKEAMKDPDKVYKLDLSKHKLDSFPVEITKFKNLQVLNLRKNKMVDIPKEIGDLTHLQWLDISRSEVVNLDPALGNLVHLKYLEMSRNDIETLPRTIGSLKELEQLIMWDNNLHKMPDEIENLKNLKLLELQDIAMDAEMQEHIQSLLPNTKIRFSPACSCKF